MCLRLSISIVFMSIVAATACGLAFEDNGATAEHWDLLDYSGSGHVSPVQDSSCPPGYGPSVLHVEGDVMMVLAKEAALPEGTFVALYRELSPAARDADGVIMVRARYGDDLSVEHNTKVMRPHVWLEQDNDLGFQFRVIDSEGKEYPVGERVGYGLVTDEWNQTDWIWQKVQVQGNRLRAKYWPAQCPEPEEWGLETDHNSDGARFGLRINSGDIHVAYFAADPSDIHPATPTAYLYAPLERVTQPNEVELTLFTNAQTQRKAEFRIVIRSGETELASTRATLDVPSGHDAHTVLLSTSVSGRETTSTVVPLTSGLPAGPCTVEISSTDGVYSTQRTFDVMPTSDVFMRFERTERLLDDLGDVLTTLKAEPNRLAAVRVIHDAARAHLAHAVSLYQEGKVDDSDLSYRFTAEALSELHGYKGDWLGSAKETLDLEFVPGQFEDTRGIDDAVDGKSDFYSTSYQLRFGEVQTQAQGWVMGKTYEVTIPWYVDGAVPDRDFDFRVSLVSPLGNRVVAQSTSGPETPTSEWRPGNVYMHRVALEVVAEDAVARPAQPVVLDEVHRLLIAVTDPESGGHVLLGNTPGDQNDRVGTAFLAGRFFVSSTPLEIHGFDPQPTLVLEERTDRMALRNAGDRRFETVLLFSASAESGRILYQDARHVQLEPGEERVLEFVWTPTTAGPLTFLVKATRDGVALTEASRTLRIDPPPGYEISIERKNHVERRDGAFVTPIVIHAGDGMRGPRSMRVYADGRLKGEAASNAGGVTVYAEPGFGYYDVVANFADFSYEQRLVATVVESASGHLLVNGEPFIVKGVNVHGLDGGSPERTASMMRIMRELGFNAWRGDYPARWQMELAYELNSVYTVLAPFSCTPTTEIFGRQAGPPLGTAREITRLFIERYRDSAGVLLWNSCNEVTAENVDFLLSIYPLYGAYDAYDRPVHYANLYGQDLWQGQDVMGVNYYFGEGQTAADRQPLIRRSVELGADHEIPAIFCEYNSYYGAIHTTGVEAMEGIFEWGVEKAGMAGGFLYMRPNSTSHPGVMDSSYNTHKIFDEAIIRAFADADVEFVEPTGGQLRVRVTNKRDFTLRQMTVTYSLSGLEMEPRQLGELEPRGVVEFVVPTEVAVPGPARTVDGRLEFVTHFGFRSSVPFSLIQHAPAAD